MRTLICIVYRRVSESSSSCWSDTILSMQEVNAEAEQFLKGSNSAETQDACDEK